MKRILNQLATELKAYPVHTTLHCATRHLTAARGNSASFVTPFLILKRLLGSSLTVTAEQDYLIVSTKGFELGLATFKELKDGAHC
jgi:hypothetical protein